MEFKLKGEYIELIQLLKATGHAQTGGHAKMLVDEGLISCNDEVEFRRRRKLRVGDFVRFEEHVIKIC